MTKDGTREYYAASIYGRREVKKPKERRKGRTNRTNKPLRFPPIHSRGSALRINQRGADSRRRYSSRRHVGGSSTAIRSNGAWCCGRNDSPPAPTKFVEEELAKARERIAQRLANLGKPVEPPKPVTVNARGRPRRHSVLKIFSQNGKKENQ